MYDLFFFFLWESFFFFIWKILSFILYVCLYKLEKIAVSFSHVKVALCRSGLCVDYTCKVFWASQWYLSGCLRSFGAMAYRARAAPGGKAGYTQWYPIDPVCSLCSGWNGLRHCVQEHTAAISQSGQTTWIEHPILIPTLLRWKGL